jgi:hypothetical protein
VNSVRAYVSALSYWSQDLGGADIASCFGIKQLLKGLERETAAPDSREPISVGGLEKMVLVLERVTQSRYERALFGAMFVTAFYGFMRVGEYTVDLPTDPPRLRLEDVEVSSRDMTVAFSDFKHNSAKKAHVVTIRERQGSAACPVKLMRAYLGLRGLQPGALFVLAGMAVRKCKFAGVLQRVCRELGWNTDRVKPHSFRIGAACWAMEQGLSDAQIRQMGRWKSNAFKVYLRPVV